ncbi:MAG: hypothetical protein QM831_14585 [Kofleriaceae bacterium]
MAASLLGAVEQELQNERASALGEAGRRVEKALAELAQGDTEDRLAEAGTAVWYFMILRESLHFFDHKAALAIYDVPPRVMARVGVVKKR